MIAPFLTEICEIHPYLREGSGGSLYGPLEVRNCRMEPAPNQKTVYKNPYGAIVETAASLLMFCQGEPLTIGSRVIWNGREMRVIKCESMMAFGLHHLEVLLE